MLISFSHENLKFCNNLSNKFSFFCVIHKFIRNRINILFWQNPKKRNKSNQKKVNNFVLVNCCVAALNSATCYKKLKLKQILRETTRYVVSK